MSLAQSHSPYPAGIQQHPGGVPQGHPMAGVPHAPGQQIPGQPGMPQQMHMGVSGPGGPQVTQAGALMGGMPPGAGGPSAHALQHLNPGQQQAQMYQQQIGQMAFSNPQLQQLQQQQLMQQHQRQALSRQAMMAQQYAGMQMGVPNGMGGQISQAQYAAAMRASGPMARSVNLPQHLQQAQQQAQQTLEQQQAQQQQHQQHLMQQMAMQQHHANAQAQAGATTPGQQGPMGPQQMQNMQQQAQIAAQHHQAQTQAASAQQNPPQSQPQQQAQPNAHGQNQQAQPQAQQQPNMQQQQAAATAAMLQNQQRVADRFKGQCLMRLMLFGDHLSNFSQVSKPLQTYMANGAPRLAAQSMKQRDDLNYWLQFVDRFFSPKGVLRHSVFVAGENTNKQYEITFPALARYFHTHFESGVTSMQMIMEKGAEKELPNNGHYIESQKSSFVYWFDNGSQVIANGTLRAHFDEQQKMELLEFVTSSHEEYIQRNVAVNAIRPLWDWAKDWHKLNTSPDVKNSPEMNKKKAKTPKSQTQPQQLPPPEVPIPHSKVKASIGVTPSLFQFLELAEVMGQMNPLFQYAHLNATLDPYAALDSYVTTVTTTGANPNAPQQNSAGPRTPGMSNFPMGTSPATAHLSLPDGSPHLGSPAQAPAMQLQQSQHGTSSSGPSANTSPNASNKRRRPSTVKTEEENQANANQAKTGVKPSPRIGGKRQKGNPA